MVKSFLKLWPVLLAAVLVVALAFACDDDDKENPVFSAGTYTGTYTVIRDYTGAAQTKTDTMTFQFLESGSVDTLIMDNDSTMAGEPKFCDYVCSWKFSIDSLRIVLLSQSIDICVAEENPAQTYYYFVDGDKFIFVKFDLNTYPPAPNSDIYRRIELWKK